MKVSVLLILASLFVAISPAPSNYTDEEAVASRVAKRQYYPPTRTPPFQPPSGKNLFFLGQERDGISSFRTAMPDVLPGGITVYTNINLGGINYGVTIGGHGFQDWGSVLSKYPNAALNVGYYLVGAINTIATTTNYDTKIREFARYLKSLNRPVYLRVGYEFDGPWNQYDPTQYKAAFKRIHQLFSAEGALPNIAFVWHAAASTAGRFNGYALSSWYPGDNYVDWCGVSMFRAATSEQILMNEVHQYCASKGKPSGVWEATPQGWHAGSQKWNTKGNGFNCPPSLVYKTPSTIWNEFHQKFFDWNVNGIGYTNWVGKVKAISFTSSDWNSFPAWAGCGEVYWGDSRIEAHSTHISNLRSQLNNGKYLPGDSNLKSALRFPAGSSSTPSGACSSCSGSYPCRCCNRQRFAMPKQWLWNFCVQEWEMDEASSRPHDEARMTLDQVRAQFEVYLRSDGYTTKSVPEKAWFLGELRKAGFPVA
ncbi:glycoside hydrolase superfamily [Paraphysoderma sedebokerense]|nr:glycoside hydrolase superfamily [Paraphysoderma sedebokerense]